MKPVRTTTIAFTGHRSGFGIEAVDQELSRILSKLISSGIVTVARSSLAEGSDLLFAQAAMAAGCEFHAYLPLSREEFREDFSSPEEWSMASELLEQSSAIHELIPPSPRPECYWLSGLEMLDGCDFLIAVWDGQPARGPGGTADITFPPAETSVLIDPPRKGCSEDFLKQLFAFCPSRVVYVSCNPATQMRDLRSFLEQGYQIDNIQPFDLFPQTRHLECVIALSRT